jgi:hypothetical protein
VVVVATPAHARAIELAIVAIGFDLHLLRDAGRYIAHDAGALLPRFMVDGMPDPAAFRAHVGGVVAKASEGGRSVRVFGEMVALLWDEDNVAGAIELESLWNELGQEQDFALYCGYPLESMAAMELLTPARQVCQQHSAVVAPPSYAAGGPAVRVDGAHTGEFSRFFVPVPLAARVVRHAIREALEAWGEHDLVADAELVVSELASNVLLHAHSPFRVAMSRVEGGVRISVHDADPLSDPKRRDMTPDSTTGRGVAIIALLARRWGTEHGPDGKIVWAELGRTPGS